MTRTTTVYTDDYENGFEDGGVVLLDRLPLDDLLDFLATGEWL